jgi:hypothetical protein
MADDLTEEQIDEQQAALWRGPAPLFGPDTRPDKHLALEAQRPAAVQRQREQYAARTARLNASVATTTATTTAPSDYDAQIGALESEFEQIMAKLGKPGGYLSPDEQERLIDRQLALTAEITKTKAQRTTGHEQADATRALEAPLLFPALPEHSALAWDEARASAMRAEVVKTEPALAPFAQELVSAVAWAEHDWLARQWKGQPRPTPATAEPAWRAAWGSAYEDNLDLASEMWELFAERFPAEAKRLTTSGLRYDRRVADVFVRAGHAYFDPLTARGLARRQAMLAERE